MSGRVKEVYVDAIQKFKAQLPYVTPAMGYKGYLDLEVDLVKTSEHLTETFKRCEAGLADAMESLELLAQRRREKSEQHEKLATVYREVHATVMSLYPLMVNSPTHLIELDSQRTAVETVIAEEDANFASYMADADKSEANYNKIRAELRACYMGLSKDLKSCSEFIAQIISEREAYQQRHKAKLNTVMQ